MTSLHHIKNRTKKLPPLRVGIGGPVGSGKTTLLEMLCKAMRDKYDLVAITNDIYTKEDQRILTVSGALPAERIMGVETGGCPHTAIREDASINLEAIDRMLDQFPNADIVFIESGGDNLAATFSPELSDLTTVVISHDRWFLDRICTHILAFEGDSEVYYFEGGFSDYEENKKKRLGGDLTPKRLKYRKLIRN